MWRQPAHGMAALYFEWPRFTLNGCVRVFLGRVQGDTTRCTYIDAAVGTYPVGWAIEDLKTKWIHQFGTWVWVPRWIPLRNHSLDNQHL